MAVTWGWYRLDDLTAREWHAVGCLRQSVFVVEQTCPFPDLDAADPDCLHLLGRDETGALLAYLRLVPPGIKYPEASLGRIVTAPEARGMGLGRALLAEGLAGHQRQYPGVANTIGAQARLEAFYQSMGFVTISEPYDEDGIQHVDMRWTPR